jgi:hypothetical protein
MIKKLTVVGESEAPAAQWPALILACAWLDLEPRGQVSSMSHENSSRSKARATAPLKRWSGRRAAFDDLVAESPRSDFLDSVERGAEIDTRLRFVQTCNLTYCTA